MKKKPTLAEFRKLWEPRTRGGYKYRIHAIDLYGEQPVLVSILLYRGWSDEKVGLNGNYWGTGPDDFDLIPRKKGGKK